MISSRLFKAFQQRGLVSAAQATPFYNAPVRFFSKENNEDAAAEQAVEEAEPVAAAEPAPKKAAPKKAAAQPATKAAEAFAPLDKALFAPFSVGNIKKIESTPDNKPPSEEDTIEGRYAGVLFVTASQNSHLYEVYEDMNFLAEIHAHCDSFRLFTQNSGVGSVEMAKMLAALQEVAPFSTTTIRFLTVLAENKRLDCLSDVTQKYQKLYQ